MADMKTTTDMKKDMKGAAGGAIGDDFFERGWQESWTYIKTVVDVVHEPVLILDQKFKVLAANQSFYRTFQVEAKETEGKVIYDIGNGQWNIPALRKLLEDILPKDTFFKGFEVSYEFPRIGQKVMILNARRIHRESKSAEAFPPIILLAMEDVTDMMTVAKKLADHTNKFEAELTKRTEILEIQIRKLAGEINGPNSAAGKGTL